MQKHLAIGQGVEKFTPKKPKGGVQRTPPPSASLRVNFEGNFSFYEIR